MGKGGLLIVFKNLCILVFLLDKLCQVGREHFESFFRLTYFERTDVVRLGLRHTGYEGEAIKFRRFPYF